ncbi:MAG: hypothetical protein RLZZ387_941 [Chloroflexota bacterium]|jgi:hypothetical protein
MPEDRLLVTLSDLKRAPRQVTITMPHKKPKGQSLTEAQMKIDVSESGRRSAQPYSQGDWPHACARTDTKPSADP